MRNRLQPEKRSKIDSYIGFTGGNNIVYSALGSVLGSGCPIAGNVFHGLQRVLPLQQGSRNLEDGLHEVRPVLKKNRVLHVENLKVAKVF